MIPKYEAIAADIRRSIEDGALKPGDKLPTVVEFCELYSVSKSSIAFPKSPSNELLNKSPRKVLLPAVVDRVPTLRTRRDFPARRFFRAKTTVPRAFHMSTAGRR